MLLRQHGGLPVVKIPQTSEGGKPGRKVFSKLIGQGMAYRAEPWTSYSGVRYPSSYELTYEGAMVANTLEEHEKLLVKAVAEQYKKIDSVGNLELDVAREETREIDPFEEEQAYET